MINWDDPAELQRRAAEMRAAEAETRRQMAKFDRVGDSTPTEVSHDPWSSLDAVCAPSSGPRADQEEFEREIRTGKALAQIEQALANEAKAEAEQQEKQRATFLNTSAIAGLTR
jgi:hypothetical protein